MPTLGQFHTLVRDSVNLGDSIDSLILAAVRQAVLWSERNHNFRYMRKNDFVWFRAGNRGPHSIVNVPKKMECIYSVTSPTIYFLERVDREDFDTLETGRPYLYFGISDNTFFLGQYPDIDYLYVAQYMAYSVWPALTTETIYTSSATHWLCTYAEDFLLYQTMMQLSPMLRDPDMAALSKNPRDEALRTLLLTEDEFEESDKSSIMNYRGYSNGRDENA